MKLSAFIVSVLSVLSISAQADFPRRDSNAAYLNPPFRRLIHPVHLVGRDARVALPPHSNVGALIALQTPVKSQASRGTCSIFSATALLESLLIINSGAPRDIDLSEEWLEYLAVRSNSDDGSSSDINFSLLETYGTTKETILPYIGESWQTSGTPLAQERCGSAHGRVRTGCLLAHWDPSFLEASDEQLSQEAPQFLAARKDAQAMQAKYFAEPSHGNHTAYTIEEIKTFLASGIPVTLDIDFYYGAWNHREATELGIERNSDHWAKGIVFYPEPGSVDVQNTRKQPAGHSVLVVGYDDNVVVTKDVRMTDGSVRTVSYRGVYYFKNSWGTGSFGSSMVIDGQPAPGYGMITQKYAEEYGQFFRMPYGRNPLRSR